MTAASLPRVAYFCMEYALDESFPIYAGGLGVLAGDYVKSAGDARVPMTAIGIFWAQGYTDQHASAHGEIHDHYPPAPRDRLAPTGARVSVDIEGREVPLAAWRVTMDGIAPLYLLEPVEERDRWITRRLYGGGARDRVAQELVLGVGGVRLLRALGIDVDVYHFNEGHAVFAGLELLRERRTAGDTLAEALAVVRERVVFTTHTPVPAGNETHPAEHLLEMGAGLGVFTAEELGEIGGEPFGMTVAGLRLARDANAVAKLHGETARRMWSHVDGAAPVGAITNGVHAPTWQDGRIRTAYASGGLAAAHRQLKHELLVEIQARKGVRLAEDVLLVGFARRAAAYKRAGLILSDEATVARLIGAGKLQLVFAGKAHPADGDGKKLLGSLIAASRRWPNAVVFLDNYDLRLGRLLTRGCDVWLNTPRRPLEASGTSGMKAAMNGVLNLSVLDGWWPEGCEHGVNGWQIGDAFEAAEPALQDAHDRQALLAVLEGEVIPRYADPAGWEAMMRASIEMAQWRFSSHRMLEDYVERLYRAGRTTDATDTNDSPRSSASH